MVGERNVIGKKFKSLRDKAETLLGPQNIVPPHLSMEKARKLFHELYTHQIELELQNEELRRTQSELEESRSRYTELYDFAPVGYLTIKGSGLISEANLTAADMLGVARKYLLKNPFSSFINPEDQDIYYQYRRNLLEKKGRQNCELRLLNKKGDFFYSQLESVFNSEVDGEVGQFRVSITDISERKANERGKINLESQVRQSYKMQAVGTLAGGIAHEFNNLLSVIMGNTELALLDIPSGSEIKKHLDQTMNASLQARDLIKQILIFSRQNVQKTTSLQLGLTVKNAIKLIEASLPSSIIIKQDIDTDCHNVMAEPGEINQIVMNFCSNAVWAMKERGIFEIAMEQVHLSSHDAERINKLSEGEYVVLSFIDTGIGMDEMTMARIFDPFYTTKEVGQGTGMGLSIIFGIMENYGGAVTVESEVGKGASFHLYFPVTDVPSAEVVDGPAEIPGGDERILFVDDEKAYAKLGENLLSGLGYVVTTETSSRKALEIFRSDPDCFDLIITDQVMPDLSGEMLVKEVKSIRPDIPIILCTGYSTQIDEQKAKNIGVNEFIYKPIRQRDLAALIRKVLGS